DVLELQYPPGKMIVFFVSMTRYKVNVFYVLFPREKEPKTSSLKSFGIGGNASLGCFVSFFAKKKRKELISRYGEIIGSSFQLDIKLVLRFVIMSCFCNAAFVRLKTFK